MATFSRPFADLSRYQQAAVQPQANVLDQFVQALNQGISLAQLPQTLQAEAQQRQQAEILNAIKVATAQKQWEELNKTPAQRLAERFEDNLIAQSYDRASGVRPLSPDLLTPEQLSIFEGGVQLQAPGALTPQQQIALEEGNVRTNVPLGAPVAPVLTPRGVPTQFSFDPTVPAGIAQQQEDARLASVEATERAKAAGKLPSRIEELETAARLKGTGVSRNTVVPPGSTLLDAAGNILFQSDPKETAERTINVPPGTKVINAAGQLIFDNPATPKPAAGTKPPAEMVNRYTKFGGVLKNIDELETKVNELVTNKKFPDAIQRAISTEVSTPPTGFVNSLYQSALKDLQSDDAKSLEATRAQVAESILTTLAGLAQTGIELRNLAPFTPQSGEPLPDLINKMKSLRSFVNSERAAVEEQFPGIKTEAPSSSAPPPKAPPATTNQKATDDFRKKHGLK